MDSVLSFPKSLSVLFRSAPPNLSLPNAWRHACMGEELSAANDLKKPDKAISLIENCQMWAKVPRYFSCWERLTSTGVREVTVESPVGLLLAGHVAPCLRHTWPVALNEIDLANELTKVVKYLHVYSICAIVKLSSLLANKWIDNPTGKIL